MSNLDLRSNALKQDAFSFRFSAPEEDGQVLDFANEHIEWVCVVVKFFSAVVALDFKIVQVREWDGSREVCDLLVDGLFVRSEVGEFGDDWCWHDGVLVKLRVTRFVGQSTFEDVPAELL